jgi:hypothetical protein
VEIDRYETGIERINAAEKEVGVTQLELVELQPKLTKSTEDI